MNQNSLFGTESENEKILVPSVGMVLGKHILIETSCLYDLIYAVDTHSGWSGLSLRLGSELSIYNQNILIGPKIGFEAYFLFLYIQVSVINYNNFKFNENKISYNIGMNLIGQINIFYSSIENINKDDTEIFKNLGKHRICFSFNFR